MRAPDLFEAVADRDANRVRQLLAAGMDANPRDEYERTPIMWAAWLTANSEAAVALLAGGADPNAQDDIGTTALVYAMETYCTVELVRVLLRAGADPNLHGGISALMRATTETSPEIVDELLRGGADPNSGQDGEGRTALMRACMVGDLRVIQMLLRAGAALDTQDSRGMTALMHLVARSDTPDAVGALLDAGADASLRCERGRSAGDYARIGRRVESLQVLQDWARRPTG